MRDMEGKIALVAAGSKGLGRASASKMAMRGASLAICARDEAACAAAAADIAEQAGVETWHCAADVSTTEGVRKFVHGAAEHFGGMDVLVSNAGGPPRGVFDELEDDAWFDAFELGVMSAVRLVREALPHMRGRGGGRILFILSSSVREPIEDLLLSNVMRPAVAGLAKSLSRALGGENILVNVVMPGVIKTERGLHGRRSLAKRLGISFEESVARVEREVPLGRLGEPEEFGAMVAFLASPEASYISGGVFAVDGGRLKAI